MFVQAQQLASPVLRWLQRGMVAGALVASALVFCGCDQLAGFGATPVEARTAEDDIEAFLTYQDALVGKTAEDVEAVFGKPKGVFERHNGTTWMYSRWRVEFDSAGAVQGLERDVAATNPGKQDSAKSMALVPPPSASKTDGASVLRISNGGKKVDLGSLMPPNKVVVVDFYADWCGPCRTIAPHLEELANGHPDVVLLKIDIVAWGTPVADQFGINSIPNVRVFDRTGRQIGEPTSSFGKVQAYVSKAVQ